MLDREKQAHVRKLEKMLKLTNAHDKSNKSQTPVRRYLFDSFEQQYWHLRLGVLSPKQVQDNLLHCALETKLYRGVKELRQTRENVLKQLAIEVWEKFDQYYDYMEKQNELDED